MFRLTTCDQLRGGRTIVKGREYDAALEAERILADARASAESTRRQAESEYERQKKQGYDDGWQQAQKVAAERMMTTVAEANTYFSAIEERVVAVVRKALRKIVGEVEQDELLVQVVRHALSWARSQSRVTLRVCSAQAPRLRQRAEEIRRSYPVITILDVVADDRLGPLDCVLETEIGTVNAGIDVQLAAIEAAMSKALGHDVCTSETPPEAAKQTTPLQPDSPVEPDA